MNENETTKTWTYTQNCPECNELHTEDAIDCYYCYGELVAIEPVTKTYTYTYNV